MIEERCKREHCVDLGESFPTSIYLMKSASIQPRTSHSKFGGNYSVLFIRVLTWQQGTSFSRLDGVCTRTVGSCAASCTNSCSARFTASSTNMYNEELHQGTETVVYNQYWKDKLRTISKPRIPSQIGMNESRVE